MRVIHVIADLNVGGAELTLKRLIESDRSAILDSVVVSLTTIGVIGESLVSLGVKVHALGMSRTADIPLALFDLVQLIKQHKPRVVQTWMYHADLLGGLAARLVGSSIVVWGIRSTGIPQGRLSITYWLVRLCAIFSHLIPHKIICNSSSAKAIHTKLGYDEKKMSVIANGYEFSIFEKHFKSREVARKALGFDENDIILGVVGRFDPLKDYGNFVTASNQVAAKVSNIKFVMVGRGLEWSNLTLREWIESSGLADRFRLVGEQKDVPFFLAAMDIFCLSSQSEAFPNVVVEAMAMRLPCVVTKAGDAADIVGEEGFIVPIKDSTALARALLRMCELGPVERQKLGECGARKVRAKYGIELMRHRFEETYQDAVRK